MSEEQECLHWIKSANWETLVLNADIRTRILELKSLASSLVVSSELTNSSYHPYPQNPTPSQPQTSSSNSLTSSSTSSTSSSSTSPPPPPEETEEVTPPPPPPASDVELSSSSSSIKKADKQTPQQQQQQQAANQQQQQQQQQQQEEEEEERLAIDYSKATRIKLVVVGDGAVGKTSLLISYATEQFPEEYIPTVFENYTAEMKLNGEPVLLHLWDTAGQEEYDRIRPLSYPGADVLLMCFSLTYRISYDAIKIKWVKEARHHIPGIPYFLVGTKLDLRKENPTAECVTTEEGLKLCEEVQAFQYLEVSARTRENLDVLFDEVVRTVVTLKEGVTGKIVSTVASGGSGGSGSVGAGDGKGKQADVSKFTKQQNKKNKCVLF